MNKIGDTLMDKMQYSKKKEMRENMRFSQEHDKLQKPSTVSRMITLTADY